MNAAELAYHMEDWTHVEKRINLVEMIKKLELQEITAKA
jgi:hypothetical protein